MLTLMKKINTLGIYVGTLIYKLCRVTNECTIDNIFTVVIFKFVL